jgi:glycosyltransferase involved in cell wall biosynthesis
MKYPNTGLYHFCKGLGEALVKNTIENDPSIGFYLPKSLEGYFGKNAQYLHQQALHKIAMPSLKKYDCWHATHQTTNFFPYKQKMPILLTVHDLNFLYDQQKSAKKKKNYIIDLQKKVDRADAIVAISQFTANDLQQHVQLKQKQISVIYNGCGVDESIKILSPSILPTQPFLYTIGTIAPKKNFHVLLELLVSTNQLLIITGITQSEKYKQFIISEAIRLGVLDQVIFTGAISEAEKYWYYANCKAFLFPSLAEGFGLPVIEAMYFGKTVLLANEGPLPEIGGDCAHYFSEFNRELMQALLFEAIEKDEQENRRLLIKEHAKQFSWDKAAKLYLQLYKTMY